MRAPRDGDSDRMTLQGSILARLFSTNAFPMQSECSATWATLRAGARRAYAWQITLI